MGDRNTRYFHACVGAKKRRNHVGMIIDERGQQWDNSDDVEKAFIDYYTGLFTRGAVGDLSPCIQPIGSRVTEAMNLDLLRSFTMEEIDVALFQMSPLKAPGPDGLNACFFQSNWSTLREEVCSVILDILNEEALSAMISHANEEGSLTGVPTSKKGPALSHLFFADDSLLFCRSTLAQWNSLTSILQAYEGASGQKMNSNKTALFFSRNSSDVDKEQIRRLAGIPINQRYDTYLGLPALVGRSRTRAFKSIKERVWKCLQDWKLNFLSQAGKEILLKAVIQAIPTYCMSIFKLPKVLCLEINSLMMKFFWGHKEKENKIHWMSWSKMSLSKAQGGLGFRDIVSFNKALLAKQIWRLWKYPDSLIAKIMKAKYYPECSVLDAPCGKKPSFAWRSIQNSSDLVNEGLIWRVGNGQSIRIWQDKWVKSQLHIECSLPQVLLTLTLL
ncbi:uncharacterized protein LOC132170205 [Corylus avellana]|uniref:uncharacterized protein LOC132170205 n=1 Tax=Corylus avellana TaxID=13451 RepID=UPI00286CA7F1|nr:uncharacterized protein LOC132170205 [Corylus avellana]